MEKGDVDDPIAKALREREIGAVIKVADEKENKPEPRQIKAPPKPPKMHEAGQVPKYLQKYKAVAEEKK